jgi:hypothetical protein
MHSRSAGHRGLWHDPSVAFVECRGAGKAFKEGKAQGNIALRGRQF